MSAPDPTDVPSSSSRETLAPVNPKFQGTPTVKKKRELFPGPPLASPSSFALPPDRLTHVQLLFAWNLSPLQSSKFSFEYLLLPPRSALETVPPRLTPMASSRATDLHACLLVDASAITSTASGFRLPWPPSCCLDELTPFVVSDERGFRHLNLAFGSSRIASSAYQKWPTRNSHSNARVQLSNSFAPIPKFDDRFARQNRYEPPPEFPLASPYSGIVHHLSGPSRCALTQTYRCIRKGRSMTPWSVFQDGSFKAITSASLAKPPACQPSAPTAPRPVSTLSDKGDEAGVGRRAPKGVRCNPQSRAAHLLRSITLPGESHLTRALSRRAKLTLTCHAKKCAHSAKRAESTPARLTSSVSLSTISPLDGVYHPFGAAIPNNSTLRMPAVCPRNNDQRRDSHPLRCHVPEDLCHRRTGDRLLQTTTRTAKQSDLKFELFPLHSPLLGESLLVSFPPLIDMLKFSGYSCLI
ncbi:10334_t:CDS:2 [Paraglomus occultum]|uniref:10334_t:CDS:1 n=1 Tax=Paraglomus occultum TaxID=144539 RepID=A0A9N9GK12_9GLOM|nr:10334_t:CDS:2 [Paraglomus occultum]